MMKKSAITAAALVLAAGCATAPTATTATAQDDFRPTYGQVDLVAGFQPDPHRFSLTSGGELQASNLGGSCTGWVAENMDFGVYYTAGSFDLTISANSDEDTTLVVMGPDYQVYCDDDSGPGLNPTVTIRNPKTGPYGVWLGSYSQGVYATSTLSISELGRR